MSFPYNEDSIPGRHTLTYRVRDSHKNFPVRNVEVLAKQDEIETLVRDGYLVRENIISPAQVEALREALADTVAREEHLEKGGGRAFGGVFLRHMEDKHPLFLELADFPPGLSVARALFGPYVQLRGMTGRVITPDEPGAETEWHFHLRLVPDPLPPMFSRPQALDVLLYLDDIDEANGPLCVLPGSHHWIEQYLDKNTFHDRPGQVRLTLSAGSCALVHGSLWHRSTPTQPGAGMRRLLLFGYSPAYMKPAIYGKKPADGLTAQLLTSGKVPEEIRELLGVAGYM